MEEERKRVEGRGKEERRRKGVEKTGAEAEETQLPESLCYSTSRCCFVPRTQETGCDGSCP